MNNRRRKRIKEAINMLEKGFELKDYDAIDYSRDIIEYVLDLLALDKVTTSRRGNSIFFFFNK